MDCGVTPRNKKYFPFLFRILYLLSILRGQLVENIFHYLAFLYNIQTMLSYYVFPGFHRLQR